MCTSAPRTQGPCGYAPQTRLHTFCSLGPLHNKTLWCLHSCKGLWVTSGWKSNGQGAPLLTPAGQHRSSRDTHWCPRVRFPSLAALPPGSSGHKPDPWWGWRQTLWSTVQLLCAQGPTSMGGFPDVPDENPAIIGGAGKNVVIHRAHWQAIHRIFMSEHI